MTRGLLFPIGPAMIELTCLCVDASAQTPAVTIRAARGLDGKGGALANAPSKFATAAS